MIIKRSLACLMLTFAGATVALSFPSSTSLSLSIPQLPGIEVSPSPEVITLCPSSDNTFDIPKGNTLFIHSLEFATPALSSEAVEIFVDDVKLFTFNRGNIVCGKGTAIELEMPLLVGEGSKITIKGSRTATLVGFTSNTPVSVASFSSDEEITLGENEIFVHLQTLTTVKCDQAFEGRFAFTAVQSSAVPKFLDADILAEQQANADGESIFLGYIIGSSNE